MVVAESRDELGRLREREAEFEADLVAIICQSDVQHRYLRDVEGSPHLVLLRFDLSETGER